MSKIIDFYRGTGTDAADRTLDEILSKRHDWMEACHDYIQWLFPLRDVSNFNPDAPLLTDEDVRIFKEDDIIKFNYVFGIYKMLDFLGIRANDEEFELGSAFEKQKYTWCEFNHNALRITRFLASMSTLGKQEFAQKLLAFMKKTHAELGVNLSSNVWMYWDDAVLGDQRKYGR